MLKDFMKNPLEKIDNEPNPTLTIPAQCQRS